MRPEEWVPSEGIDATAQLMNIIHDESSQSILAGAGSGKTEMLAQKASYLLQTGRCPWPNKILCLSFKIEARANIEERVGSRCANHVERFTAFTFHAFAKSIVDRFRSALPEAIRPAPGYDLVFKDNQANGTSKVSMGSIIQLALQIIETRDDIRLLFSAAYRYVFIDEFQDTSAEQYKLIKLFFHGTDTSVICVGDLNQSIMLWANASPTVFNDFKSDFAATDKFLTTNYRASAEIQVVLNKFLEYVQHVGLQHLPAQIAPSACKLVSFDNEYTEAEYLKEVIKKLLLDGVKEHEICVLTKQQSSQYSETLRNRLSGEGIRNIDMSDLQDSLKEPIGQIYSLFLKVLVSRDPISWNKLTALYLKLNQVDVDNTDLEAELIYDLSKKLSQVKNALPVVPSFEQVRDSIYKLIRSLDAKKIRAYWPQYKSTQYLNEIVQKLSSHLNYSMLSTTSLLDASLMFAAENSIQIMNIHKCKGLEYKVVIFLGIEDEAFWKYTDDNFEEKCTMFVALSRAEEKILVSMSNHREHRVTPRHDNRLSNFNRVSNLLQFLEHKCLFNWVQEGQAANTVF